MGGVRDGNRESRHIQGKWEQHSERLQRLLSALKKPSKTLDPQPSRTSALIFTLVVAVKYNAEGAPATFCVIEKLISLQFPGLEIRK